MVEVKLLKAVRVAPDKPLCVPGQIVEVDDVVADRLGALGAAEVLVEPEVITVGEPLGEAGSPAEVLVEPEVDEAPESEILPAPVKPAARPLRTAPLAEWKDYAERIGLKVTNMKKEELIGAVEQFEA